MCVCVSRTDGRSEGTCCSWSRGSGGERGQLRSGQAQGRRRWGERGGTGPSISALYDLVAHHTSGRMILCVCVCVCVCVSTVYSTLCIFCLPSLSMAVCGVRPGTRGPSVSKLFLNRIISTCNSFSCHQRKIKILTHTENLKVTCRSVSLSWMCFSTQSRRWWVESAIRTSPSHSSLSVSTCTTSLRGRDGVYSLHKQEYPNIIVYIWLEVRNEEYRDGITLRPNDNTEQLT